MDNNLKYLLNLYWDNIDINKKREILKKYNFWDGFAIYKFEYLPNDLISVLFDEYKNNCSNNN